MCLPYRRLSRRRLSSLTPPDKNLQEAHGLDTIQLAVSWFPLRHQDRSPRVKGHPAAFGISGLSFLVLGSLSICRGLFLRCFGNTHTWYSRSSTWWATKSPFAAALNNERRYSSSSS